MYVIVIVFFFSFWLNLLIFSIFYLFFFICGHLMKILIASPLVIGKEFSLSIKCVLTSP